MSEKIDDGGPAFPPNAGWRDSDPSRRGLSMRDWLAGMALQGLFAGGGDYAHKHAATESYKLADAMLEARKGKDHD